MEPKIWGPGAWLFLHSVTLNYPKNPTLETKKIYMDFFNILTKILPCNICSKNLLKHYQQYPIKFHLDSKESLIKWLVNIHNLNNKDLKKSTFSYADFIKLYKKIYNPINYKKYFFIFILLLILVTVIYKKIIK